MRVILGEEVRNFIKNYERAMIRLKYKNKERAILKRNELKSVLKNLDKFSGRQCEFKDLGQEFDQNGEPINPYLRQYHWGPFAFSFIVDAKNDRIYMKKIMQSSYVKEDIEQNYHDSISEVFLWMKRLDEVKGARPTYWCQ